MAVNGISLRSRLQASSLLAVLAGYAVLLVVNRELSSRSRLASHVQAADLLVLELRQLSSNQGLPGFEKRLEQMISPGRLLWLELEPGRPYQQPTATSAFPLPVPLPDLLTVATGRSHGPDQARAFQLGGRSYLSSGHPLPYLGRSVRMILLEDVTADVERQRTVQLLLVAAAGVSSLFTSALLRLVLRRGLVRPLADFGAQLQAVQAPPCPGDLIAAAQQPQELQPIALAFNDLQERLATSWERQRAFVDGVAHELRTPITLISGHAESLLRHGPSAAVAPSLRLIELEARRMGTLVSDLLDLARQDSGRLSLRCQTIMADDVLLEALERLGPGSQGRLRLEDAGEDAPDLPMALGDPDRLQQCLAALVENALRYSPSPCPVTLCASSGLHGQLVLHVRDSGPGVSPEERELIFGRFVRGSAALQSRARGSGIGLSVVRLLMEAMGGVVQAADAPGGGADFQLHLAEVRAWEPAASA